jgi:hypothetical protein
LGSKQKQKRQTPHKGEEKQKKKKKPLTLGGLLWTRGAHERGEGRKERKGASGVTFQIESSKNRQRKQPPWGPRGAHLKRKGFQPEGLNRLNISKGLDVRIPNHLDIPNHLNVSKDVPLRKTWVNQGRDIRSSRAS